MSDPRPLAGHLPETAGSGSPARPFHPAEVCHGIEIVGGVMHCPVCGVSWEVDEDPPPGCIVRRRAA